MRNAGLLFVVVMTTLAASGVSARENPSLQDLSERLKAITPPYWVVASMRVTATANAGDAVDPKIKQRFEATVKPDRPLFAEDKKAADTLAPYIPIVPTVDMKQMRILYGVAESTYSAGDWRVEIELENSVKNLGEPKSMFAGPTLIRGSRRENEMQKILASDLARKVEQQAQAEIREIQTQSAAEIRSVKAAQAKALADSKTEFKAAKRKLNKQKQKLAAERESLDRQKIKLQARIQKQKAKRDARMRELTAAQAKSLDRLRAKQAAEKRAQKQKLDNLKAANQRTVAKARQSHQDKRDTLKAAEKAEIESIKQAHAEAVSRLKAKQEGQLAMLRQENRQQLAQAKAGYEHKIAMLQQQIEDSSKLLVLQKEKKKKEANLAANREQALKDRAQQTQTLLAEFRKKIAADDADARRSAFTAALDSGNPLLRRTAMTLAFRGDDPMLKTAAFEQGLKSSDKPLRRAAINAGLASDDTDHRSRALVAALEGKDLVLQHRALTEIFLELNAFTGTYQYNSETRPFTIKISGFGRASDTLKGDLLGWDYCDDMTGNLNGNEVTMGNDKECAAHFTLATSSKMKGELVDRTGHRYEASATIGH